MDLQKDKYIIAEIIPTRSDPKEGFIAQISALKLDGIKLEDRFDYRVEDKFIESEDLKQMISYDKKSFTYVNNIYFIIEKFKQWAKDYPLLLLEENYTNDGGYFDCGLFPGTLCRHLQKDGAWRIRNRCYRDNSGAFFLIQ